MSRRLPRPDPLDLSAIVRDAPQPLYFKDEAALAHSSFPFIFLYAEMLTTVITNHVAMFREEDLGKKIPQARSLYFWLSTLPKPICVYPKSVSKGPFDFEYPHDAFLSRPRRLDDRGMRPELYFKDDRHDIPAGLVASSKLMSFARLMQKLEEGFCHVVAVEGNAITFVSDEINFGLSQCGGLKGAHTVQFRIDFSEAQVDRVRDAFALHAPGMLEQSNYLPEDEHCDAVKGLRHSLRESGLADRYFKLQAQISKDGEVERDWYDVLILADAVTGQPVRSDVDDFARSRNENWPHANDKVEIMVGADDEENIEMAIDHIYHFLQTVLNSTAAYEGEPENMLKLRLEVIQAMLAEIEIPAGAGNPLFYQAAQVYHRFAQDMPVGAGSALHIVYAQIKHFITRELVKRELAEYPELLEAIGLDAFAKSTGLTRHQPDSDFDPKTRCAKVKYEAPENDSGLGPLRSAPAAIKDRNLN